MTINNQLILGEVSFGGHRYLATLHYCDDGGNPKKVPATATNEVAEVFRSSLQKVLDTEVASSKSLLGRVTSEGLFFSGEGAPVNYSSEKAQQAWKTFLLLTEAPENALTIAPHSGSGSHVQLSRMPEYGGDERLGHLKAIRNKFSKEGPYVLTDVEKYLLTQMGLDQLSRGVKQRYQLTKLYAAIILAEEAKAPIIEVSDDESTIEPGAIEHQPALCKHEDARLLNKDEFKVLALFHHRCASSIFSKEGCATSDPTDHEKALLKRLGFKTLCKGDLDGAELTRLHTMLGAADKALRAAAQPQEIFVDLDEG